eukprot:gene8617-biopygen22648
MDHHLFTPRTTSTSSDAVLVATCGRQLSLTLLSPEAVSRWPLVCAGRFTWSLVCAGPFQVPHVHFKWPVSVSNGPCPFQVTQVRFKWPTVRRAPQTGLRDNSSPGLTTKLATDEARRGEARRGEVEVAYKVQLSAR